jgi:hypothetical protein
MDSFARIDFTQRECEALREVREFFRGLANATLYRADGNKDVKRIQRQMWELCNNVGKNAPNGDFIPVDLSAEQCACAYDACLFISELLVAEIQAGERNLRAELFSSVVIGLKAKLTAASQLFAQRSVIAL